MYKVFDYVFFRAYTFYQKKKSAIPVDRGIQVVCFIQIAIFFAVVALADFLFDVLPNFHQYYFNKYLLGLPLSFSILIINEVRYKQMAKRNGFKPFKDAWGNEGGKSKKIRGWLIIIIPALLLVGTPVLLYVLK